jgi:hypothetical protein
MVADDSPDLPDEIKKIRDLFKTHYEGIYKRNFNNDKNYQKIVDEAEKAIYTDYGIKIGGNPLYFFLAKLIYFDYKESLDYIKQRFEMMKKEALKYEDLPHFPYLLGVIKRVIDKMKNINGAKKNVYKYLETKFRSDMVNRLTDGVEPFPL